MAQLGDSFYSYFEQLSQEPKQRKAFLICPVRGQSVGGTAHIVYKLEAEGWKVHWPHRDTKQDDSTGYHICKVNCAAIADADIVFVVWDGQSQGCLFDLGIAFALNKPVQIISLPELTKGKSFQNMVTEWANR
ncbi:nucleoside 2-deoxyribosyltransferase [Candidatus Bathyarchaeota archaeon]|nr:nucleoside 2-deoxyribosyltransferase [Candidatus Bathyarchaeota archaeon]